MKLATEDGKYKIICSDKELEYILANRLKANTNLSPSDVEEIAKKTIGKLYPNKLYNRIERDAEKISSGEFYTNTLTYLFNEAMEEV